MIHGNNNFNRKYWEIIGSILSGLQGDPNYRGTNLLHPFKCANILFYFPAKEAYKNEEIRSQGARSPRHTFRIVMPSKEQKQRAGSDGTRVDKSSNMASQRHRSATNEHKYTSETCTSRFVIPLYLLEYKVIILQGCSSHNTTTLSAIYNLSTTCFGQCCCGHHQVAYNLSEKLYGYNREQLIVLVWISGRGLVYTKSVGVCAEGKEPCI